MTFFLNIKIQDNNISLLMKQKVQCQILMMLYIIIRNFWIQN